MSRHNSHRRGFPKHDFSRSPVVGIPRARFDRSHNHKTTIDAGYLYPIFVDEALPGDTFRMRATGFARIATLINPIMDDLKIDLHWFFVPSRILWEHWENFMGANIPNTNSSTDYVLPTITAPAMGGFTSGSLFDYMGLPVGVDSLVINNALPLRGFNQIYNDWYRDQNYNDMVTVETDDGPDTVSNYAILHRNKRYDYFTAALPFPQKGVAVSIPLTGDAPIIGIGKQDQAFDGTSVSVYETGNATPVVYPFAEGFNSAFTDSAFFAKGSAATGGLPEIYADLSDVTSATINALRLAATTQQMYEQDARGGTRLTEIIQSHFKVISPDARLQRAEYLNGHTQAVVIHSVPQTAPSDVGGSGEQLSPQANLAAFGTCVINDSGFTYSFQEHGYVYGIVSVRSNYTYYQGVERFWNRSARFDFYWPTFANIGEQAILNIEIYAQGNSTDQEVFGYQGVWDDYRYKPSRLSSLFRPGVSGTLDVWHLAQIFGSLPTLNDTFIAESPPMARIEAVANQPDFICDFHFNYNCIRPMPIAPVPGIRRL